MFEQETESLKLAKQREQEETTIIQADEALAKAVIGLLKTSDPDLMSELNTDQHKAFSSLAMRATKYDINCLQTYLTGWLKLMVSHDRKGRKEIHSIAVAQSRAEQSKGKIDRLKEMFGLGGDY